MTNEGGAWGRYRYLKNIMGLWMVQSIRRELSGEKYVEGRDNDATIEALKGIEDWQKGRKYSFRDLEMAARGSVSYQVVVNVDDARFMNPESMIAEVVDAAERAGERPRTIGDIVQCVYKSLAEAYADTIEKLSAITGRNFSTIHIVGGGCQDKYLNTLTAEATGLNVVVGPVEATATGNLIVQMIAAGEFKDLDEARKAIPT